MNDPQIHATAHRCPRCGSTLVSDGQAVWCSFVGDVYTPSCMYGLDRPAARCERCGGPLDNVSPGYSIVEGGAKVCANCVQPREEIARARGL